MNCLEFRKAVLTEPGQRDSAMDMHAAECSGCAAYARSAEAFELQLRAAVEVPEPQGLAQRILLHRHAESAAPGWSIDRRRFLAAAASVTVAATGMLGFSLWRQRGLFAEDLVAHVGENHPAGMGAGVPGVSESAARTLFAAAGFSAGRIPDHVVDAWPCPVRGVVGAHLRLEQAEGRADILYCPGELILTRRSFEQGGVHGMLYPQARGTLAVLATSEQALQQLQGPVRDLLGPDGDV
jgi:hypothetical protein